MRSLPTVLRVSTAALGLAGGLALSLVSFRPQVAVSATPVRLHLALKRAEPRVNDTLTVSPSSLSLWFTESVQAAGTAIRLTGPGDKTIALGDVSVDAAPLSPAVAKVSTPLAAGTYVVQWKTMAKDGHPTSGKYSFTVVGAE